MRRAESVAVAVMVSMVAASGLVLARPAAAAARIRYVATTGSDDTGNTCLDPDRPCLYIQQAVDASAAGDTVSVSAGVYRNIVTIDKSLTIRGNGVVGIVPEPPPLATTQNAVTVAGDPADPITVTLDHLEIVGGDVFPALVATNATTLLQDSNVSGTFNTVGVTVGDGAMRIVRSTVNGNGTGVVVNGRPQGTPTRVTLDHSTLEGNEMRGASNGPNTVLTVADSTFNRNGDASIYTHGGSTTVTDSTIAATSPNELSPPTTLRGGIVFDDSAGSPTVRSGVSVSRTIVAESRGVPDCRGAVTDGGYNLSGDSGNSCKFSDARHDLVRTGAGLGPSGFHGGPTDTRVPAKTSAALDVIPASRCVADDQRGVERPQGARCDIGAVEVQQNRLDITTAHSLPGGTVGQRFRTRFEASGGLGSPYEFGLADGSRPLPTGLRLSSDGVLSGTPTTAGSFRFTVRVDDATSETYTLAVGAAVATAGDDTAPIAATGADPLPLSILGLVLLTAGFATLGAARRIGVRPGRHRPASTSGSGT